MYHYNIWSSIALKGHIQGHSDFEGFYLVKGALNLGFMPLLDLQH